jgi:O-antigen ligase
MSTIITTQSQTWPMFRDFETPSFATTQPNRAPFLVLTSIAVALSAVVMFEPSPSDVAISLLFVAGFLGGAIKWDNKLTIPYTLLSLFVVANLASLCYAIDVTKGAVYLGITMFMLVTWVFIIGVLNRFEQQGADAVMTALTFGGVASTVAATLCYFNVLPFGEWLLFYDRVKGLFKDPNVFGPYLVIVSIYSLHRVILGGNAGKKLIWLGSCLIGSVGVLLCYSRAAWMNYAVTIVVFFGLITLAGKGSRRKNLSYFIICLVIVGAAVGYAMTIPQVAEVISYRSELQSYDADRFANFHAALQLGINNPLGVGPVQSFLMLDYATHNVYLRVFSENGILGFLSFTVFLLITLLRTLLLSQKAADRSQRALFALVSASVCGTMLNSFTIDTLHWRHFWLLLAFGWMPLWKSNRTPALQKRRVS